LLSWRKHIRIEPLGSKLIDRTGHQEEVQMNPLVAWTLRGNVVGPPKQQDGVPDTQRITFALYEIFPD
jgi:hypothetical protein